MQSAIRQLHAAKEAAQKAVAEVNQLQEELAESLPTTEADRQQAVEKLDRLYVYAIERLHEERCAALCTRRRLEAIGKEPESRPASPASGSVRPPYPASSTSTASSSEQVWMRTAPPSQTLMAPGCCQLNASRNCTCTTRT
eukprot:4974675-Pleurochrysis_carterae.AAC.1